MAFLYTGQGSQYANMLRRLREREPIVAETFAEADRVMAPLLDRPLSDYLFADPADPAAIERAERELRNTEITQPAVLTVDIALTRLLAAHGLVPDLVMGHSLGEYGALVAAGALPFADALEAVSARGRGMADLHLADNGRMAADLRPARAGAPHPRDGGRLRRDRERQQREPGGDRRRERRRGARGGGVPHAGRERGRRSP